jgi:pantoate ligase / CMP/dCMP kinase
MNRADVNAPLVVALDGPAGSGKSTVAKAVAARLGLGHLDTGAMYRAVAWRCVDSGVSLDDVSAMTRVAETVQINVGVDGAGRQVVTVDGIDITAAIRTPEIDRAVSPVASAAPVRAALVAQQRQWASVRGGAVMEGRDIATAVFPDAPVKVYLTASDEERARRRAAQSGDAVESVLADIRRRDEVDSTRSADPLRVADGATVVDTTGLTVEQVVDQIVGLVPADLLDRVSALRSSGGAGKFGTQVMARTIADVPTSPVVLSGFERFLYGTLHRIVRGIVRWWIITEYRGLDNVPATGAFIVSPNHRSVVDFMLVGPITRRRLRYLGKDSVWDVKWFVPIANGLGGIPVARGTADRESMNRCIDALRSGEPLVLFPEGQRKSGPVIEEMFDGVGYIAVKANVPILPIGIGGSESVMPKGAKFPRRRHVSVIIGKPIDPPEVGRSARKAAPQITGQLRSELQLLFDAASVRAGELNR